MTAPPKRRPMTRALPTRRPLNVTTLRMMVQSGVVRRADFDPPSFGIKTRFHLRDERDHDSATQAASDQGWLARIILGRRAQVFVSKRSWRG
jgi:hypothetical protein